jgi:hypothetical protein
MLIDNFYVSTVAFLAMLAIHATSYPLNRDRGIVYIDVSGRIVLGIANSPRGLVPPAPDCNGATMHDYALSKVTITTGMSEVWIYTNKCNLDCTTRSTWFPTIRR